MAVLLIASKLQDLRFSQQHCGRFKSSAMWHGVAGTVAANIWKDQCLHLKVQTVHTSDVTVLLCKGQQLKFGKYM